MFDEPAKTETFDQDQNRETSIALDGLTSSQFALANQPVDRGLSDLSGLYDVFRYARQSHLLSRKSSFEMDDVQLIRASMKIFRLKRNQRFPRFEARYPQGRNKVSNPTGPGIVGEGFVVPTENCFYFIGKETHDFLFCAFKRSDLIDGRAIGIVTRYHDSDGPFSSKVFLRSSDETEDLQKLDSEIREFPCNRENLETHRLDSSELAKITNCAPLDGFSTIVANDQHIASLIDEEKISTMIK